MKKILVTGAAGYLGSKLCEQLAKDGNNVVALDLSGESNSRFKEISNIHPVTCDILDEKSLAEHMKGIDQVYHIAALARNWAKDPRDFYRINIQGTTNVIEAAGKCGVARIVVTSSAGTLGPVPSGEQLVREDQVRDTGFYNDYEMSKFIADEKVQHYVSQGMNIVIVCPTRIFGPSNRETQGASLTNILNRYAEKKWRIKIGCNDRGNYAFIDDVVQGHILAMERGRIGEKYLLGSFNDTVNGIFRTIDDMRGYRHLTFSVPLVILKLYAISLRGLGELFNFDPVVTVSWLEKISKDWSTDLSKAINELGLQPTDKATALRATLDIFSAKTDK